MKPTTVAILLVVLLIAIVVLLSPQFMTPSGGPRHDDSADAQVIPDEILNASIDQISVKTGLDKLELVKKNGRWWVELPHIFPGNTVAIDELLTTLHEVKGTPIIEDANDGEESHSYPVWPAVFIETEQLTIGIAIENRLGAGRAVIGIIKITSDKDSFAYERYNVNTKLHDWLEGLNPLDFLAKSIDPLMMPDVALIEIKSNQESSILEQSDGHWWIGNGDSREPALEGGLPTHPGVSDYFSLLNSFEIIEHQRYARHHDRLARFGLDHPLIAARFEMRNEGEDWLLQVGVPADPEDQTRFVSYSRSDDRYPAVFTVATPIALAFGQRATNFRDPRIVTTPIELIKSIVLRHGDDTVETLVLDEGSRPLLGQAPNLLTPLSFTRVAEALKQMSDIRAIDYVPIDSNDEWDALRFAFIEPKLDGIEEVIAIYPDPQSDSENPTVLVRRGREPVALRVPRSAVAGLLDPGTLVADR